MFYFVQRAVDGDGNTRHLQLVRQQLGYFSCNRGEVVKVQEVVGRYDTLGAALAEARRLNSYHQEAS